MNKEICSSELCTSCYVCMEQCKFHAITLVEQIDGRIIPKIDPGKCTNCGACKRVCPNQIMVKLNMVKTCYAAQRKDRETRKTSSSGGLAAVLYEHYIKTKNGAAIGAAIDSELNVHLQCEDTLDGIKKFKTSKYVFANSSKVYGIVKKKLLAGIETVFIGTPCQVAALRNYLGKDFSNLLCVDLICHGTPPSSYLKQHIAKIDRKADSFSFRGGEEDKVFRVYKDKFSKYEKSWWKDSYFWSFMQRVILSENCYNCRYAQSMRTGDLTIGDFWGLDRKTMKVPMNDRISVLLVNTEKGKHIISEIKNDLLLEERDINEAIQGNQSLQKPSSVNPCRDDFIKQYSITGDFDKSFYNSDAYRDFNTERLRKTLSGTIFGRIYRKIRRIISLNFPNFSHSK